MGLPRSFRLRDGREALLRQATEEDAAPFLDLINEVGAEEIYLQTERIEKSVDEERHWIRGFDGVSSHLLVASIEGRRVGSSEVLRGRQRKNQHVGEIGISIRKEARDRGLGRAMMQEGIEWARTAGLQKLHLSVFRSNERAVALYLSLGFEQEGELKGQVILRGESDDVLLLSLWM